jgi:hypothetical protein
VTESVLRTAGIFASAQQILFFVVYVVIFLVCLWALIDCATRPQRAFPSAGKRTKTFWLAIVGVATVVSFLAVPLGVIPTAIFQFLAWAGLVGSIVYMVDVRPAVRPYSKRRRGRGGSSSRGGW